jgi:hypothetical protein
VFDVEVAPATLEIFDDQTAVALVGFVFAAQESAAGQK